MAKVLTFFEFSGYLKGDGSISTDLQSSGLSNRQIDWLDSLRIDLGSEVVAPFSVTRHKVTAKGLVGCFSKPGLTIEVLPKIYNGAAATEELRERSARCLIAMLAATKFSEVWIGEMAGQTSIRGAVIEILISSFAESLSRYIHRGLKRSYIERIEETSAVRGRLSFSQGRLYPPHSILRPVCVWEDLSSETKLNRMLSWLARSLKGITQNNVTRNQLDILSSTMEAVGQPVFDPLALAITSEIKRDSNLSRLISISKMILANRSPGAALGQDQNITVAFEMNELFEEFVVSQFRKYRSELGIRRITPQKGKRLISGYRDLGQQELTEAKVRNTFSDLVLELDSGVSIVIDSKYKLLDETKPTLGIKNADVYQIATYCELHAESGTKPAAALLYPRHGKDIRRSFRLNADNDFWFSVSSIDLVRLTSGNSQAALEEMSAVIKLAPIVRVP